MMAFEIEQTIQSQYAASPRINALAEGFAQLVMPDADIQLFFDNIFNFETASGYGLDIWGRIVGIGRKIKDVPSSEQYLGFEPQGAVNEQADTFNNATFYAEGSGGGTYILEDAAYRLLINTKAMANVGTGSLAALNQQLHHLMPDAAVGVLNVGPMKIRIYVQSYLQIYEKNLLLRGDLPPIPAGVGFELLQVDPFTFGFYGSGLQGFGAGVFMLNGGEVLNVNY